MNLNTYMPVRLYTGAGCIDKNAAVLKEFGTRCLIVTGKHAAKASGALDDVITALEGNSQSYALFDGIGANPHLTDCMQAAAEAISFGAEFILGIGGGSALDAAKCIAVLAANPGMTQAQLYAFDWANQPLKIVLVGTTAGTGSEVTKVSVITTPEGRKKSFHHEGIYAAAAFGDYRYTMSLSENVTRSTAVDVLAHCAESYFNKKANELSRIYATEGIKLILPVFRAMANSGFENISAQQREQLYCASLLGGMAINPTGTAFPHTVGYLLTEKYSVPHGTACAVFQKTFWEHNRAVDKDLCDAFLKAIGSTEDEYLSLIAAITPKVNISMTETDIASASGRWENNNSVKNSLGSVTPDEISAMLRSLFVK